MLNHHINHLNVENEIELYTNQEFQKFSFLTIFLNWNISVIIRANSIKLGRLVVGGQLEGIMSQNLYLGPSFHFMKSGKCSHRNA